MVLHFGASVRRFNNIWACIDSDIISNTKNYSNNTRNYFKNSSRAFQSRVMLTEIEKIEDDVDRKILNLLGV